MMLSTSEYGPKGSISEDLLNRKELVQSISEVITSSDVSRGLIIGISGKWGSGKSTLVNFVKEKVETENIVFIDFNPWLYSSQEDLSVRLLDTLSYHTSEKKFKKKRYYSVSKDASKILEKLSSVTPDPVLSELFSIFSLLLRDNSEGIPLDRLKDKISEKLRQSTRRYVVVMDDVDRLDPSEIRMIMKLVRSVADFSNVIYILCYDDTIVRKALKTKSYSGQEYLQKIVNVPIRLPEISPSIPIQYLINEYKKSIKRTELNEYEIGVFQQLRSLSPSMREVLIISSSFQILFNTSKNNTCPIDLLALTFIDVRDPDVYQWISQNRYRLCGEYIPSLSSLMSGKEETILDEYKQDKWNPIFINLISVLFPKFRTVYSHTHLIMEYRICVSKYVNNYFKLTPSSLDVSDSDVQEFMSIDSPQEFLNYVLRNDPEFISELVYRVCDKIDKTPNLMYHASTLSRIILSQPFGEGIYLEFELSSRLAPIVKSYLSSLSNFKSRLEFLDSVKPQDNPHKVVFYSAIIHRDIQSIVGDDEKSYNELCLMIKDSISNFTDLSSIEKPTEIFSLLYAISQTDENYAKEILLKLKPDQNQRIELYRSLSALGYPVDLLTSLAGDSPYHGNLIHFDPT